jgi:hypothetical protein
VIVVVTDDFAFYHAAVAELRDRSNGELTVSGELAREVALGELTLEEAIDEQRGE